MMPGDPIDMVVDQKVSEERKEEIRHEMGYDQPFLTQYKNWVSDVVQGDFGTSTRYKMQVWDLNPGDCHCTAIRIIVCSQKR